MDNGSGKVRGIFFIILFGIPLVPTIYELIYGFLCHEHVAMLVVMLFGAYFVMAYISGWEIHVGAVTVNNTHEMRFIRLAIFLIGCTAYVSGLDRYVEISHDMNCKPIQMVAR